MMRNVCSDVGLQTDYVCREGNDITHNYSNLPWVAENNVTSPGPGPMVIIFKSNKTIDHSRNSRLFRISILVWTKPETSSLVNMAQETQEPTSDRGGHAQETPRGFQILVWWA